MIKKFFIVAALMIAGSSIAQEGATTSPYSFYGVGIQKFKGTVEQEAMGGMQLYSDSLHLNLLNPAGLGKLKYTTFTVGGSHTEISVKDAFTKESNSVSSLDYIALGFPLSNNLGFSFGLVPYTAVGYNLNDSDDVTFNTFEGRGGLNRVFAATGYEVTEGLTVGISGNYNFGNIQNETVRSLEDVQFGTKEFNRSDLGGFSFELGAQYERELNNGLELRSSFKYVPSSKISSENSREISSIRFSNLGLIQDVDLEVVEVADSDFDYPSSYTLGLGLGAENKWFFGAEFRRKQSSNFTNRTFNLPDVNFKDASEFRLGGFYTPKYNSISSYWQRVTYRAGFRFEGSGVVVNNEDINEFGISFGVGLPAGRRISSLNLTLEYGQRGTTAADLVQEEFLNVGVSLSLNDLWFVKTKFN